MMVSIMLEKVIQKNLGSLSPGSAPSFSPAWGLWKLRFSSCLGFGLRLFHLLFGIRFGFGASGANIGAPGSIARASTNTPSIFGIIASRTSQNTCSNTWLTNRWGRCIIIIFYTCPMKITTQKNVPLLGRRHVRLRWHNYRSTIRLHLPLKEIWPFSPISWSFQFLFGLLFGFFLVTLFLEPLPFPFPGPLPPPLPRPLPPLPGAGTSIGLVVTSTCT